MEEEFGCQDLLAFADLFLVQCPKCKNCARVFTPQNALGVNESIIVPGHETKRVSCNQCGFSKDKHPSKKSNHYEFDFNLFEQNPEADWYFGLPLYLQIPCCGRQLWFLNERHLDYIEAYLKKGVRPSNTYYMSIESRLPKWMKSSKNRVQVLRAIQKLKENI
ncbi:hypothetical protein [Planococcus dechangensis]|uniref:Uncharacterized protein n=1 Tax=Planococcus dechangensis TaxID=1176255 RepID=A0ABV9MEI8_9BACL